MERMLPKSSYVREFAAGVDPLGFWSVPLGAERERQGTGNHTAASLASLAGGAIGGGLLLPSAFSGLQSVVKSGRLGSFAAGAMMPWRAIRATRNAQAQLRNNDFRGAFQTMRQTVPEAPHALSAVPEFLGSFSMNQARNQGLGSAAADALGRTIRPHYTGIGASAVVGGVGAVAQYNKGVSMERDTQHRVNTAVMQSHGLPAGGRDSTQGMPLNRQPQTGLPPAYGHAFGKYSTLVQPSAGAGRLPRVPTGTFRQVNNIPRYARGRMLPARQSVLPKTPPKAQRGPRVRPVRGV